MLRVDQNQSEYNLIFLGKRRVKASVSLKCIIFDVILNKGSRNSFFFFFFPEKHSGPLSGLDGFP